MIDPSSTPAELLEGLTLDGGWIVGNRITPAGGTGGNFSVRYHAVGPDGREVFLKAMNIKKLFENPGVDFIGAMKELGTHFAHERDMLKKCENMSRVVTALAFGQVTIPASPLGIVPYFIFEKASGDIRNQLTALGPNADDSWKMRSLHHISVGLSQMHSRYIAHQDVKPSNVLQFPNGSQIGDLGRVSERGIVCPFDDLSHTGDLTYAPPEIFYGYFSADWNERRFGPDLYLLGNMVVYLFTQLTMNAFLYKSLDPRFGRFVWRQDYIAVLPYLQDAFTSALDEIESQIPDTLLAQEIRKIVSELCHPDAMKRGNPPTNRKARSRFSLEQYVSKFDMMARKLELKRRS